MRAIIWIYWENWDKNTWQWLDFIKNWPILWERNSEICQKTEPTWVFDPKILQNFVEKKRAWFGLEKTNSEVEKWPTSVFWCWMPLQRFCRLRRQGRASLRRRCIGPRFPEHRRYCRRWSGTVRSGHGRTPGWSRLSRPSYFCKKITQIIAKILPPVCTVW